MYVFVHAFSRNNHHNSDIVHNNYYTTMKNVVRREFWTITLMSNFYHTSHTRDKILFLIRCNLVVLLPELVQN